MEDVQSDVRIRQGPTQAPVWIALIHMLLPSLRIWPDVPTVGICHIWFKDESHGHVFNGKGGGEGEGEGTKQESIHLPSSIEVRA